MKVLKVKKDNFKEAVLEAAAFLRAGKITAYPTETFYGLGGIATNKKVRQKIYEIKKREKNKQLPIIVNSLKMLGRYVKVDSRIKEINAKHWPGPLSIVIETNEAGKESFGQDSIGVRISPHPFIKALLKEIDEPIISTSANPSGQPSTTSGEMAVKYFEKKKIQPDLVLDSGELPPSKGSTFVDLRGEQPVVLRKGDIDFK